MTRTSEQDRVKRKIDSESIDHLAEWLEMTLGPRVAAFASGIDDPAEIHRYAEGAEEPGPDIDRRLRNLYAVTWYLAANDGPGSAYRWLLEPNPELDDRTPADLLHDGEPPEAVWFAAAPAF